MDTPKDPDERARTYERFRKAHADMKKLKPKVDAMAAEDLAAGATIAQLAERTGLLPEVFRRKARKADVPVDPRYQERAEKLRAPKAAVAETVPNEEDAALDIDTLPLAEAQRLAGLVEEDSETPSGWVQRVTAGVPLERQARAIVKAALAAGYLSESQIRH